MRRSYFGSLLAGILVVGAISASGSARAGGSVPILIQDDAPLASVTKAAGVCTFEPGPLGTLFGVFANDRWDAIYTRVDPGSCVACPIPTSLTLNSVSFRWRWGSSSCTVTSATIEVSVVGSTGGACPAPDPSVVLCAPTTTIITGTVPTIYTLPMPSGCCISQQAFVRVRVVSTTGAVCAPFTFTSNSATPCQQYATTVNGFTTITDMANPALFGLFAWFNIDADCCQPTPTMPRTWGKLKSIYR